MIYGPYSLGMNDISSCLFRQHGGHATNASRPALSPREFKHTALSTYASQTEPASL